MKTIRKALFFFLTYMIIVIFSSCFSDWSGDTGTFSISIGGSGSGRVVWNDINTDELTHVITLEGPGPRQDRTLLPGAKTTVQFSVIPGMWKISVQALLDDELVARGFEEREIKPGHNNPITITMGKPALVDMVWVAGGSFQMGDAVYSYSSPVHTVTLSGFSIGKYEVTQEQYQTVMGTNPSYFTTGADDGEVQEKRPVENVSWYDSIEFCNKLSSREGLTPVYTINGTTVTADWSQNGYRLPTEAQWEYAAKGGPRSNSYSYSGSDYIDDVAWHSGYKTHEVGRKVPNELGIYDMSGNVWEWCWDWYGDYTNTAIDPTGALSGTLRVQRGGGYNDISSTGYFRSAYRKGYGEPYINLGFRVVRPAPPSVEPGTRGLYFELIDDEKAYRVSRGTATGNIVIPAFYRPDENSEYLPVTTISNGTDGYNSNAFGGTENPPTYNTTVTRITFAPGSQLTTISNHAFYRCTNLAGIDIPDSVTSIGECAFEKTSLTSITIPPRVTVISDGTFYDCIRLESITIPASITKIDNNAFQGCTSLTSVTFLGEGINFENTSFPGNADWRMNAAYTSGGKGTYIRSGNGNGSYEDPYVWTKQ